MNSACGKVPPCGETLATAQTRRMLGAKEGAIYAGWHSHHRQADRLDEHGRVRQAARHPARKAHRPRGNARPHGDRRPARVCGPRDQGGAVCRKRAKGIPRRFEARHGHRHAGHDRHGAGNASGHRRRGRGARGAGALYRRAFAAPADVLRAQGQRAEAL